MTPKTVRRRTLCQTSKEKKVIWRLMIRVKQTPSMTKVTEEMAAAAEAMVETETDAATPATPATPAAVALVLVLDMVDVVDVAMTNAATPITAVTNTTTVCVTIINTMCATSTDIISTTTITTPVVTLIVIIVVVIIAVDVVMDTEEWERDLLRLKTIPQRFWHQKIIKFEDLMPGFIKFGDLMPGFRI